MLPALTGVLPATDQLYLMIWFLGVFYSLSDVPYVLMRSFITIRFDPHESSFFRLSLFLFLTAKVLDATLPPNNFET